MSRDYRTGLIITGDASGGIRAIRATEGELEKLNNRFASGSRHTRQFGSDSSRAGQQVREINDGATEASQGLTLLRRAATLAIASFSIRQIGAYADGWSDLNARILNATKDTDVAETTMRRIAETANSTYSSLNQTAEAYLNNASTLTELGYSTERQLDLADALNNSLVISATKGQQAESVMMAISRSFAAGELRGANFNTVLQNGGRIVDALAAGLGVNTIKLREMAADGLLTTEKVFEALTSQMEVLRKEAEDMPATIEDGWTRIGNASQELVGRVDRAFGASEGVAGVMVDASDVIRASIDPLIDNLDTIGDTATLVAAVIAGRYAASFATATTSMIAKTVASRASIVAEAEAALAVTRRTAAEALAEKRLLGRAVAEARVTQGTDAHSAALARLGVQRQRATQAATAHTVATNASTAAMARASVTAQGLAVAGRAASGALALVGGPVGVATLAATAFFLFRDSSDEVVSSLNDLRQPLDTIIERFQTMNADLREGEILKWSQAVRDETDDVRQSIQEFQSEVLQATVSQQGRSERPAFIESILSGFRDIEAGAKTFDDVLQQVLARADVQPHVIDSWRGQAAEISSSVTAVQEGSAVLQTLQGLQDSAAQGAEALGRSVRTNAPSAEALNQWEQYNQKIRESIAALNDPSALGAVSRDLDSMGITGQFRRSLTLISAMELERLKEQEERQKQAAGAAKTAASEAERAYRQQVQAAEQAAKQQAAAFRSIQQEMDPLLAEHDKYIERLGVIDQALADGTLTQEAYGETVRWAATQYARAATGAEDYEKQTKALVSTYDRHNQRARELQDTLRDINERYRAGEIDGEQYGRMINVVREEMQKLAFDADPAAQEMARAWEEAGNRIDETFADAFAGAFDSFDSFADQLLDGFKRLLAEMAYQATLKPIVVAFTGDMRSMMSGGGGGFGNTIGAARGLMSGSSLFGSGTAAASAGGLYAGASTGAAVGGLYGNVATGGIASTGIMSSITAGVSAAMPWIAGGLAIDSLIGGGITKAISSLFGSSRAPQLALATTASHSGPDGGWIGHGSAYMQSALGNVGIADRGSHGVGRVMSGDDQTRLLSMIVEMDNALASLAQSPEELNRMAEAVQGVRISASDAAGIADQLSQRTVAAVGAIDGEFGAFIGSLGTDVDVIIARAQSAVSALNLLGSASENLNLQFDVSALGALRAADTIAQLAGGIDQLASVQESYYQAFFSEAERAVNLERELTQVLNQMGYALPTTRDGFRALVEQQNQLTESGQQNYVQLLQLSGAFDQLQTMLDNTGNGVDSFASRLAELNDEIGTLENDVRRAYQAFERQAFDQQLTLLGLMGDEQAALTLQRERELQGIDPLLHETQRRIWGLEDEATAQRDAARAGQEYARSIAQISDQLAGTFSGINQWIDQRTATGGTPGMNLTEAGDQFARQLILAQSGDRDALQSITQYADRYLTAGEGMYASGDGFQRIQQDVLDALSELPEQISPEQFLADEIRAALQQTVGELPGGIASSLHPLFDSIDLDASGLIDWNEFYGAFAGMASDEELRRIFDQLDKDGTGTISRLEALNRTNEATEGNTQTLEERAREQLQELHGLTDEMTRSTDQMITLNSSMLSLRDAIAALGVAQDDVARIEAERAAAEQAERDRISHERQVATYTSAASRHSAQSVAAIGRAQRGVDAASLGAAELAEISRMIEQYAGDDGLLQRDEYSVLSRSVEALEEGHYRGVARTLALAARHASQAAFDERDAANVGADGNDLVDAAGINYWDLWKEHLRFDGSHKTGLWDVPFDGYVAELHRDEMVVPAETAGRLRDLPGRGLPIPNVPLPQFPHLGNDDVVQVLTDLRNENKQLRTDINRLLGDVKTNTGNTANAVASSAARAEQQRETQASELRDMARNSRVKGRTV
ncbi:MAG: tape measure protein [Halomonas sp.]|nr:tape measure protein [Halomonas sp.]MCC5904088.1 tape measure protein [Halomonas sp.]